MYAVVTLEFAKNFYHIQSWNIPEGTKVAVMLFLVLFGPHILCLFVGLMRWLDKVEKEDKQLKLDL